MAGFQTMNMPRPVFGGRPAMPVVDVALVRPRVPAPVKIAKRVVEEPVRKNRNITGAMVKRMREKRMKNESVRSIAAELKCSQKSVWDYTRDIAEPEEGWKKNGTRSTVDKDGARTLLAQGMPRKVIAEMLGVSLSAVDRAVSGGGKTHYRDKQIGRLCSVVSHASGILPFALRAHRGNRGVPRCISDTRRVLFWIVRCKLPTRTFQQIADALGGFERTTCAHAFTDLERVADHYQVDRSLPPADLTRLMLSLDWAAVRKAA